MRKKERKKGGKKKLGSHPNYKGIVFDDINMTLGINQRTSN